MHFKNIQETAQATKGMHNWKATSYLKDGLPRVFSGKESTNQYRKHKRCGFSPWVRKIPCRRQWQPTPVLLPGEFHGQGSLVGYSPWGHKESDTTERLSTHTHTYLKDVTLKKQSVPFRRYNAGVGRCVLAKQWCWTQGQWPTKSVEFLLHVPKNAESNADLKGFGVDSLVIEHILVNQAPKGQLRTYRAYGQINPYVSSPCHLETILTEKEQVIPKLEGEVAQKKKISQKKLKYINMAQE